MPARILAVVGSGTGIGKTAVTRRLRDDLRARGTAASCMKPFVSGRLPDGRWSDLEILECEAVSAFDAPLCPLAATRSGERGLDPEAVLESVRARASDLEGGWLLVEGIGGAMVPLAPGVTWLDWHAHDRWPALVVGSAGLGTINHVLLTIASLKGRGIPVVGFVLSETTSEPPGVADANAAIIAEFSGVVPMGILHYDSGSSEVGRWDAAVVDRLEKSLG